jgi:anti-sigma B factor antagonist
MAFQLNTRKVGQVVVVEAVGRLTLTDGHTRLRDLIHVSTGEGAKKFLLNFTQVEYIDSHGVGELVRCYTVVRQTGGELKLACANQKVLNVLEISHLNRVFEIHSEEVAALQAYGEPC